MKSYLLPLAIIGFLAGGVITWFALRPACGCRG